MDNNKIKIAQVIGRTNNGGVENYIINYVSNMDLSKYRFDFFVENECEMINKEVVESFGGKLFIIPKYKKIFDYQKKLVNIFKQESYDIVQANNNSLSVFTLKAAKIAGIKIRISNSLSMSSKKEKIRYIIKSFLKMFSKKYPTHFFACSNLCGQWLYGRKITENKNYYKVNNAIDYDKYLFNVQYREELIKKHNLNNEFVVGTIGRLEPQKNHMFLLDIFNSILKINSNSKLIIIGDGYLKDRIETKINNLNIRDKVIILSSKDVGVRESALKYYSLFDCFVLPSLYEGLPTVGIEAQINTLPCFMSDTITTETRISDRCDFISLNKNSDEWAKIIINGSRIERKEHFDVYDYDIKVQAKNLENLYHKFLQEE